MVKVAEEWVETYKTAFHKHIQEMSWEVAGEVGVGWAACRAALEAVAPLIAQQERERIEAITDDTLSAASAAVWNEFLYDLDGFTFNGAMARPASLDDADKIASIALRATARSRRAEGGDAG